MINSLRAAALLFLLVSNLAAVPEEWRDIRLARNASPQLQDAAGFIASRIAIDAAHAPQIHSTSLWQRSSDGIVIGARPAHPAFDPDPVIDEILIVREGGRWSIHGKDNVSTAMAVYRFAELMLGWYQLQPGQLGLARSSQRPSAEDLQAWPDGIVLHERAGFASRNLSGLGNFSDAPNWALYNRLRERFSYNHTVHRLVTPELFESRPHWFAKDAQGQPMVPPFPEPNGYNDHPDLTEQEVRDWHVDQVVREIVRGTPLQSPQPLPEPFSPGNPRWQLSPGLLSVSLGLGDSFIFGEFDADEPLRASGWFRRYPDWSPLVFDYSNEIAERALAQYNALPWARGPKPPLYFGTLAYLLWEEVPPFPVQPNIVPILTFDRSQWYDAKARADDLATVRRWADMGTDYLGTWDYLFGIGFFVPRSMVGIVSDSVPALADAGVNAYYSQIGATWPFDGHTNWLLARLLWQPDADPDALLDLYFDAFYGPAAPHTRAFFDLAEQQWMSQQAEGWWLRFWKDPWQAALFLDDGLLDQLADHLSAAQQALHRHGAEPVFHQRLTELHDAFAICSAFVRFHSAVWELQADLPELRLSAEALGPWTQLAETAFTERTLFHHLVKTRADSNPRMQYFRDTKWVELYDSFASILLEAATLHPSARLTNLLQAVDPALADGFAPVIRTPQPVLYDTDFSDLDNPRIWTPHMLPAEGVAIEKAGSDGGLTVRNARRASAHQLFNATPGRLYHASLEIEADQSPSGQLYLQVQFYNADQKRIATTPASRFAPVAVAGRKQIIHSSLVAPEGTAFGRLFIRFFEMDPYSSAVLHSVNVQEFRPAEDPR